MLEKINSSTTTINKNIQIIAERIKQSKISDEVSTHVLELSRETEKLKYCEKQSNEIMANMELLKQVQVVAEIMCALVVNLIYLFAEFFKGV